MISDIELDRESPEDEPTLLAWDLAQRLEQRARQRDIPPFGYQLRAISELVYRVGADHPGRSEDLASQLENLTTYVRKNLK